MKVNELFIKLANVSIDYFEFDRASGHDFIIVSKENWRIFLDMSKDIDDQMNNLGLLFQERFSKDRKSLEYIDLRFGEKVYYKN